MRLNKAQRESVLEWIAEGLESDEMNRRASSLDPAFSVSRQQVDFYRKTRKVAIEDIKQAAEFDALSTGLARASVRVEKLKELAERLELDLFATDDKIWTLEVKGVGSGAAAEVVEYYEFNRSEIDAYRGVIDDIARETGGRVQKTDITSKGEAIQFVNIGVDVEQL